MRIKLFISAYWLASSFLTAQEAHFIDSHWALQNGKVVLVPQKTSSRKAKPIEKFDPYLDASPTSPYGYIKTPLFKTKKIMDDHSIDLPFSKGDIPQEIPTSSSNNLTVKTNPTEKGLTIVQFNALKTRSTSKSQRRLESKIFADRASKRDLTASELMTWGLTLQAIEEDFSQQWKRENMDGEEVKAASLALRNYKKHSQLYRQQIARKKN